MQPQSDLEPLEWWIRDRIRESGPVTVAQFMAWALYHPDYGYYTAGPNIGPRGDFTTSPEASPAFGRLFARHLQDIDELLGHPSPFDAIECGPGRGTLASDLLDTLQAEQAGLYARLRYRLVEISPSLVSVQRDRLLPGHASVARWLGSVQEIPAGAQGAVIANEFVDAFPVHVLANQDGAIVEQFITLDKEGNLALTYLPTSSPDLERFLEEQAITLEPGERIEINLAANEWLGQLSDVFDRGVVTIIDYGDAAPTRYSPARREGTLLGYYGGKVTDNILAHPGKQDLTALMDFTALQSAAHQAGFTVAGMTRQSNFLLGLGLGTTLTAESATTSLEAALQYRRGLQALISMEGLGRFHVLLLSKNLSPEQTSSLAALTYAGL
jgi:SAM-dependent MidA family methyltransferase